MTLLTLTPGNAPTAVGVQGLLRRLIPKVWAAFPRARVRVRLDGGLATPALFDELEAAGVDYVVAMAKNPVLEAAAAPWLAEARLQAERTGASARVFGETRYQAKSWPHPRRAVIKAEVVVHPGRALRDNPRIVITNLRHSPERLYREIYCARGDSENRLKELHHDLAVGRTSCSRFWANQLRVTLTAAAYVLLQELQLRADRTSLARAQVGRLRLVLLKIGVRVTRSVRRVVLHLPRAHPDPHAWQRIARRFGAFTPNRIAGLPNPVVVSTLDSTCASLVRVYLGPVPCRPQPPLVTASRAPRPQSRCTHRTNTTLRAPFIRCDE